MKVCYIFPLFLPSSFGFTYVLERLVDIPPQAIDQFYYALHIQIILIFLTIDFINFEILEQVKPECYFLGASQTLYLIPKYQPTSNFLSKVL